MKKLTPALFLGLSLVLFLGIVPLAYAGEVVPQNPAKSAQYSPPAQAGTGAIRVALTGADAPGCGSVAAPCATVQFAVDAALPGEEIHIAAGTYAGVQIRNGLTQTVYISKSLTLRGGYSTADGFAASNPIANPTILDAQLAGRVILITDSVAATIENLIVTRGSIGGIGLCTAGDSCGGGIMATGPLTVSHVNVISNSAGRFGGGVGALTTTTVINSQFERNAAFLNVSAGGGLYTEGPLSINGTDFISNTSLHIGGAVRVNNENDKKDKNAAVTIITSRFEQNQAGTAGGGLSVGYDTVISNSVLISLTTFISNTTGDNGGGVSAFNAHMTVLDSHFENNQALSKNGGGINLLASLFPTVRGSLLITNTNVISNWAALNGGGVWFNDELIITGGRFERNYAGGNQTAFSDGGGGLAVGALELRDTQFISNTSGEDGGAIFASLGAVIENAQFTFNRAITNGGAIMVRMGLTLTNTNFISNTAGYNGGGTYAFFGPATINGGRFEGNRADGPENNGGSHLTENGGGGIWVGSTLVLTNTQFISNTAQTNGGGAHVRGSATMSGGLFDQNQSFGDFSFSGYGGGGLYALSDLTFVDTVFTNNQAASHGGGALVFGSGSGTGGRFENNVAGTNGGGLWVGRSLSLATTQLLSNVAELNGGGAIAGIGSTLTDTITLSDVLVQANRTISTSVFGGGGLFAGSNGGSGTDTVSVTNSRFINNETTGAGGGLNATGRITLDNSLFQQNSSDNSGGGAYVSSVFATGSLSVTDSQFLSNTAAGNGGGLFQAFSSSVDGFITDTQFQNNRSLNGSGGGVSGLRLNFTNTTLANNSAQLNGGGANGGTLSLFNSRVEQNSSVAGSGGGLYSNSNITLENSDVLSNTSGQNGGGIHTDFRVTVANSLLQDNTAQADGGGLWAKNRTHISGTRLINNQAGSLGGGVAISGTFETPNDLINNLFTRNTAATGNALYINIGDGNDPDDIGGTVNLVHATIANPAPAAGIAIYVVTDTVNITNSIVSGYATDLHVEAIGTINEDYNLYPDGRQTTGTGTFNLGANSLLTGTPDFVDPAAENYYILPSSAAINAGVDAGVNVDFEGDARPLDGGFDIGFDEQFNSTPIAVDNPYTIAEDTTLSAPPSAGVLDNDSDPDGDPLTATVVISPTHGAFTFSGNGNFSYTPAINFSGSDVFTYTAHDNKGGVATATATINVSPVNDAPIIGKPTVMYDGSLGTLPSSQNFLYVTNPLFGALAQQTLVPGGVRLDTTPVTGEYAGYFGLTPPTLNRNSGYTLRFTLKINSETHAGSDKNGDGKDDRAGFSVIAMSSDVRGIELGFWGKEIWAQHDGAAEPPPNSNTLFTHAEGAAFNTTAAPVNYELTVLGEAYTLTANGAQILHGRLRDYSAAVVPFPVNPYTTPNLIFLGDDTPSASADIELSGVSVITDMAPADRTTPSNTNLIIDDIRTLDIDAGSNTVVVTMTVNSGVLSVTTIAPGGLSAGSISGNGTGTVVLTGPVGQINTMLAYTPALIYRSNVGFSGVDTLTTTINDLGHTGGLPLTDEKSLQINVIGPNLSIEKSAVTDDPLFVGGSITYTIVLTNAGNADAFNVLLTDTLPAEVDFANWVQQPAGAIAAGDAISWTGSVLTGSNVTFSFAVTHTGKPFDVFTNTAHFAHPAGGSAGSSSVMVAEDSRASNVLITKSSMRNQQAGLITYTIIVQNLGPDNADGMIVFDAIPFGISAFNWQCGASGGASCTANGSGSISDTLTGFPAGSQVVYTVTATLVSSDTTVVNTATLVLPPNFINTAPTNSAVDTSNPTGNLFLPLILKGDTTPPPPPASPPDLIVDSLVADSNSVTVTIKNIGGSPVVDAFWVDVYINPNTPPTAVNQLWDDVGTQGMVWGVVAPALPLAANGGTLTLITYGDYYYPNLSRFTPPLVAPIYGQVDSAHIYTGYGNVLESHEISGGTYNNINNTLTVSIAPVADLPPAGDTLISSDTLPPR